MIAYLRFERLNTGKSYALSLTLYVLALLSKAVASMTAPALVLLRWMVYSWVADHFQYLASLAIIALLCALLTKAAMALSSRAAQAIPSRRQLGTGGRPVGFARHTNVSRQ